MLDSPQFLSLLRRIALAWLLGCAASWLVGLLDVSTLAPLQIGKISLASGVIAVVSVLSFSKVACRAFGGPSVVDILTGDMGLFVAFSIGMTIRILGTVALFLLCRYQMVAQTMQIAVWVLTWYFYLTVVEILLFVCQSPQKHDPVDCCR